MLKKILILGHSNIGDVCYDLAVVRPLRRHCPKSKIFFLTSHRAIDIVTGYDGVDETVVFDKYGLHRGLAGRLKITRNLRQHRFDLVVVLTSSLMYKLIACRRALSIRKFLGCDPVRLKRHVVDIYLEFLSSFGIAAPEAEFGFQWAREDEDYCDDFLKKNGIGKEDKFIGIAVCAAWPLKSWPIEKWNKLAAKAKDELGFRVINIARISNDAFGQEIRKNMSERIISTQNTTLKQVLALINRCRIFIGPDSGLLHLASCLKKETIGLYGATAADFIYPYFHRHNIVKCRKYFPCLPCYPQGDSSPCKDKVIFGRCMQAISVDEVLEKIKSVVC
ncbi:MAG: glycosyltransferase family 9 protein [Candidatus Omnitrophota bacterium]